MKLLKLWYDNFGIARAEIEGDRGIIYNVNADGEYNILWCTCPHNVLHNYKVSCKHIRYLIDNLDYDKMIKKELNYLDTGCTTINNLIGGGIPYSIVTTVFAEPNIGKTMFTNQCGLANIAFTKKNTILIETEGLRNYDTKVILYKLMKRFKLDKETVDKKFIVKQTVGDLKFMSIQKLFMMFGSMVTFRISDKGKYTPDFNDKLTPLISEDDLKKKSMIIIDSITKPMKNSVGSETQNLPARAQITEKLFSKLYNIAMIYDIAVVVNVHSSVNPVTIGWKDPGKPYGGQPILYNSKYALQIRDSTNKLKKESGFGLEARRVQLLRAPGLQTTKEEFNVRLQKDYGYVDE